MRTCVLLGGPLDGAVVDIADGATEVMFPITYPTAGTVLYVLTTESSHEASSVMRYRA